MTMQQTDDSVVLLTTVPDRDTGDLLATGLVETSLAACVNLLPPMQSYYVWQDKVESDTEQQLIIKTTRARLEDAEAYIRQHHPYDVPELIALPVDSMGHDYLTWLKQSVQ